MAKKKISVSVSEELYAWCYDRSKEYGLSVPALFVIAMAQYKEQSIVMNEMPNIINKLQEMNNKGVLPK